MTPPASSVSDQIQKTGDDGTAEADSDLPSPVFEPISGSSCDGLPPNFNPPSVAEDIVVVEDNSNASAIFSKLSHCSDDMSTDTWNITFPSKLSDAQKSRLNVIMKAFEFNQIGKNKKFDYYRRFMRRHNVDLIVTPENYKAIYAQVHSIGDLPDFKTNPAKLKMVTAALNCIVRLGFIDDRNKLLPGFPENDIVEEFALLRVKFVRWPNLHNERPNPVEVGLFLRVLALEIMPEVKTVPLIQVLSL